MASLGLVSIKYYFRQAQIKKDSARAKQREVELYNKKAEEATNHADELKRERDRCLQRISGTQDSTAEKVFIYLVRGFYTSSVYFRIPATHRRLHVQDE